MITGRIPPLTEQFEWNETQIKILKEYWNNYPASRIGRILGTSRNSVIGKAHRLNLPTKRKNKNVTQPD